MGAGVVAQALASHLRIPGIVLLLIAGAGLGPDALGWVQPRTLGTGLFPIVDLAVAVILFEGGLQLKISRLRREQRAIRRLVLLGPLVTMLGAALAVQFFLDLGWVPALVFGSLVVVTGPTVIGPLISELRLKTKVSTVLQAEGLLIDPIGAILAVLVFELALAPNADSLTGGAIELAMTVGLGTLAGFAGGLVIGSILRVRHLVPEGHENIFALAAVLVLFQICEEIVPESGILAVALAGVVVGNFESEAIRELRGFKDQISVLLIGMLFVLLAADVRFDDVRALGWGGAAVLGALVLIVRPLNVLLSTNGSDLPMRERLFVAWIAPRGIVAAAVASVVAEGLDSRGLDGGAEIRALVFLTIAGTVVLAGLTGRPVAHLLHLRLPRRDTVAILGAQGLGLALAEELRACEIPVIFLDSNPQNCHRAEQAKFPVIYGNALQERTLARARFDRVETAIGLTPNQTLNTLFVTRVRELYRVPQAYIAIEDVESGYAPELAEKDWAHLLFEMPHDVERWDVRGRHGELVVEHRSYRDAGGDEESRAALASEVGERFAILSVRRGKNVVPMSPALVPRDGDVALVAIHVPDRDEALRLLDEMGWREEEKPAESSAVV